MKTYKETVNAVIEAVRNRIAKLEGFNPGQGCIRILFRPLCEEADAWSGDMGFSEADIREYETTATIIPCGTHTVLRDGHISSAFGQTALTIASCSRNRGKHGIRLSYSGQSTANPDIVPQNGFLNARGCACYTVTHLGGNPANPKREIEWGRWYVSVAGSINDAENEAAAGAAVRVLQECMTNGDKSYRLI